MLFPEDVVIPAGVTRMGLLAWASMGPSQVGVCVVFDAKAGHRYTVAVEGFRRDWAVSISSNGDRVVPFLVRHREFKPDVLPCEGVGF